MDIDNVNGAAGIEKVVPCDEISSTAGSIDNSSTSAQDVLISDSDSSQRQRDKTLSSASLSININKTQDTADDEPPIIVQVPDLRTAPSLRGRMMVEDNMHKCQGVWAMNDSSHAVAGQTSDFELRLVFSGVAPQDVPVDGRYSGWFMIKNPQKNSATKIEDRDLDIKFTKKRQQQ